MRIIDATNRQALERVLARDRGSDPAFERRVASIVERVRRDGDRALVRFAKRFDGVAPPFEVSAAQMRRLAGEVPSQVRRAIRQAATHIERVAKRQVPKSYRVAAAP